MLTWPIIREAEPHCLGSALSIVSAKDDSSLVCDTPNLIITALAVI
nr:MAG TPA: hypothetical protein [Caudoviricetes sp.]DAY95640.1 MAG TPA: hypothetical protein [Caudoviricetes sp.]